MSLKYEPASEQVTLELATDLYEYSGKEIRLYVWDKATNAWAKTTGNTWALWMCLPMG